MNIILQNEYNINECMMMAMEELYKHDHKIKI
jgi:hypothetical protein